MEMREKEREKEIEDLSKFVERGFVCVVISNVFLRLC